VLGSPAYMSPEQARGGDIGPQSDVFSLGVLLYQLATGRMPFGGKDPLTVIAAILNGEFLRPAQVEARVGPELEAVILRCLRRAPAERYADGSAVRAALARVAAREPGVAEGPDTDLLSGPMRADGCHWSSAGAAAAARLWAPHVLHALRSAAP